MESTTTYALTNAFIVLYLFYAYAWTAPDTSAFKPLLGVIRPVVRYFGLWHSWSMFAPTLFSITRRVELELQFEDGGTFLWKPTYSPEMTRWERFCHERFRKLGENCRDGEFSYVRWSLCEYVIRIAKIEHGPDRKIKQVLLYHLDEPIVDYQTPPEKDLSTKRTLHYTFTVKS